MHITIFQPRVRMKLTVDRFGARLVMMMMMTIDWLVVMMMMMTIDWLVMMMMMTIDWLVVMMMMMMMTSTADHQHHDHQKHHQNQYHYRHHHHHHHHHNLPQNQSATESISRQFVFSNFSVCSFFSQKHRKRFIYVKIYLAHFYPAQKKRQELLLFLVCLIGRQKNLKFWS